MPVVVRARGLIYSMTAMHEQRARGGPNNHRINWDEAYYTEESVITLCSRSRAVIISVHNIYITSAVLLSRDA